MSLPTPSQSVSHKWFHQCVNHKKKLSFKLPLPTFSSFRFFRHLFDSGSIRYFIYGWPLKTYWWLRQLNYSSCWGNQGSSNWRFTLQGHSMKFLFVSNNLHVFQVGLDSPHHLSLIEGFFYIRFLYVWYLVDKCQIESEQIY